MAPARPAAVGNADSKIFREQDSDRGVWNSEPTPSPSKEGSRAWKKVSRPLTVGCYDSKARVDSEKRGEAAGLLKDAKMDIDLTKPRRELEEEMLTAANNLEFEKAALLRDQIKELKRMMGGETAPAKSVGPTSCARGKGRKRG